MLRCLLFAVLLFLFCSNLALAGHDNLEWYDEQTGQLKSPVLEPLTDPTAPQKWVWKPRNKTNPGRSWQFPAIGDFAAFVIEVILWVLAGITLIWLIVYVLNSFQNFESARSQHPQRDDDDDSIATHKLAELPFATGSSKSNLLDAAREFYESSEYGRAIICLFGYQLLQLDRHDRIHLWKGKTNGQYLREVKSDAWLSNLLGETIHTFEAHFFGNHPVSREQFESCWQHMDEFGTRLEAST